MSQVEDFVEKQVLRLQPVVVPSMVDLSVDICREGLSPAAEMSLLPYGRHADDLWKLLWYQQHSLVRRLMAVAANNSRV